MTTYLDVLRRREELPKHLLFTNLPNDLTKIISPAELNYHPDSILSALDNLYIYPNQMKHSGVFGDDFVAIRCAPVDEYNMTQAKVECVYLRCEKDSWVAKNSANVVNQEELERFHNLANWQEVKMGNIIWKRI